MPPTFTVIVRDQGEPVAGLKVRVKLDVSEGEGEAIDEGLTDSKGSFHTEDLPVGVYWVVVGENTAFQQWHHVTVSRRSLYRISNVLDSSWMPDRVLTVKALHGVVAHFDLAVEQEGATSRAPLAKVLLRVKDARSEKVIAEATSRDDGSFAFAGLPHGLYKVEVKLQKDVERNMEWIHEGDFALEIRSDADASSDPIELAVAFTSCGLMWDAKSLR